MIPKPHWAGESQIAGQQKLLLRAALLTGPAAILAWEKWASKINIDAIDPNSYRLLPLLYHNLSTHHINHPLVGRLKGIHRFTWYKNQILLKYMSKVLCSLEDARIRTIVLKGAALISFYYKDFGLRPMEDLDILVLQGQAEEAISLLEKSGWTPLTYVPSKFIEEYRSLTHAIHFIDASGFQIDLHWHVLARCLERNADYDFWKNAIPMNINNTSTFALSHTDQLLHVCAHSLFHPSDLRWIADTITILNNTSEIDWDYLLYQVKKHHLALPIRESLNYIHKEFGMPIPERFLQAILSWRVTMFERFEYKALACQPEAYGPLRAFWRLFSRYARSKGKCNTIKLLMGFPSYLQVVFKISHLWQVPFYTFYKLMRRIWLMAVRYQNQLLSSKKFSSSN